MRIGIDARCIQGKNHTGVASYAKFFLRKILAACPENEYVLLSNSLAGKKPILKNIINQDARVHSVHRHFPNKLLNFSFCAFNRPYIDDLIPAHLDIFLSLNPYFGDVHGGAKTVQIIHDLTQFIYPEFYSLKMRAAARFFKLKEKMEKATVITVPSKTTADDAVFFYEKLGGTQSADSIENKIKIIPPTIDQRFFAHPGLTPINMMREKYKLPERFVLYLGTIEPRKNVDTLIKAFDAWQNRTKNHQDVHLVIAGAQGWKNSSVKRAYDRAKNKNKIHFIGYVAEEEKFALYSAAELFIFLSFYEGFGLPPLEALASGTPVITSAAASLIEYFGSHALLVDPLRPLEIAAAMEEYIDNSEKIHPLNERMAFTKKFMAGNATETAEKIKGIFNLCTF